jgi:hypothetical protein
MKPMYRDQVIGELSAVPRIKLLDVGKEYTFS